MSDVTDVNSSVLQAMSDSEKQQYGVNCRPKVSQTEGANAIANDDLDSDQFQQMNREVETKIIKQMVDNKSREELINTKFFFVSSNIQCVVNGEYRPLEIGIVEYTIKKGITRWYHQFIDCGPIPLGYASEAKEHSEKTHKLPMNPSDFALPSDKFDIIGLVIHDFLESSCHDGSFVGSGVPMIVFSHSDQIEQNSGSIKWIANNCNEMRRRKSQAVLQFDVVVLNVNKLLYSLMEVAKNPQCLGWCSKIMTSPAFDYSPGTDCYYHSEIDCIECALGVVKRIAYMLSHCLTKFFDVEILAKHYPIIQGLERLRIKDEKEPEDEGIEGLLAKLREPIDRDDHGASSLRTVDEKVVVKEEAVSDKESDDEVKAKEEDEHEVDDARSIV